MKHTDRNRQPEVPSRRSGRAHRRMVLAAGLLVVTVSALGGSRAPVASAAHAVTPTQQGQVPNPFKSGAAGSYAWGAATMPDGTVIIGDIWNRRVVQYDTAGHLMGTLIQLQGGDAPYGLAVDPRNNTIYIGRQFPAGPEKWVKNGGGYTMAGLLHANGMKYPSRVGVAPDGTVYIPDQLANTVFVFNGDTGQLKSSFGSTGSGNGQFILPRGIAIDTTNSRVYVMDCGNERVEVFDYSGKFQFAFGSKGTAPNQFHGENTRGMAIDKAHGWLFVSDVAAGGVHKFDLKGNWISNIGHNNNSAGFPTPPGTFTQGGREVAVSGNELWVGDMPNFRVQVFDDTTGKFLFEQPNPVQLPPDGAFNDPRGLAVDSAGNLYVADTHNFRLEKFDPSGKWVWSIGHRAGTINPDTFNYTRNMVADPTQLVFYLADTYNNAIDKYDTNGNLLWQIVGQGNGPGQFGYPSGVAVAANHNVYVADSRNNRIQVFEPTAGHFLSMWKCTNCSDPRGVAIDPVSGNVYVADMVGKLLEFTASGTYIKTIASQGNGPGQLTSASDVVADSTYIYVADSIGTTVDIYNRSTGGFVTAISGIPLPSALALGPSNDKLYVTEEYADRVTIWCVVGC